MSAGDIIRTLEFDEADKMKYGICPFCKNPVKTLSVDQKTKTFFCYSCGKNGALNKIFYRQRPFYKRQEVERTEVEQLLLQMHTEAQKVYTKAIQSKEGKAAKEYIKARGYKAADITKYGIGYAPKDDVLLKLFQDRYPKELMKRSGLFCIFADGSMHDLFRNRLMIPIANEDGEIIAFGGRVLGDYKPKYINSPETELFSKRKNLFGYPKEAKGDTILVCEGYMDCLAIKRAGFSDCVATLGTALTEEQMQMIASRYKNIYLSFDSDAAGLAAAKKVIGTLKDLGMVIHIPSYQPYKDPDEMIREKGRRSFIKCLATSITADEFLRRNATPEELIQILIQNQNK